MQNLILKYLIIFMLLFLIGGCKKDIQNEENYIVCAGYSYYPDRLTILDSSFLFFKIKKIDLDKDNVSDLIFWSQLFIKPYYQLLSTYLEVKDSNFQIAVTLDSISPYYFFLGDTINFYQYWKSSKPFIRYPLNCNDEQYNASLVLCEDNTLYGYFVNYWNNKTGYIGFRKMNFLGKYSYGWIKVKVNNFYQFYAFEFYY